jgi:hypothetical protein
VAVTPAGAPETAKLTVPKAPRRVVDTVAARGAPPDVRFIVAGASAIAKSTAGGVGTVTASVAACVLVPSVPITDTTYAPGAAFDVAVIVSVALPPAVTDVGVSVAVTPVGTPDTAKLTVPAAPTIVVAIATAMPVPLGNDTDAGVAAIEKSLACATGGATRTAGAPAAASDQRSAPRTSSAGRRNAAGRRDARDIAISPGFVA